MIVSIGLIVMASLWVLGTTLIAIDGVLCLNDDCPCTACECCDTDTSSESYDITPKDINGTGNCADLSGNTYTATKDGECH